MRCIVCFFRTWKEEKDIFTYANACLLTQKNNIYLSILFEALYFFAFFSSGKWQQLLYIVFSMSCCMYVV